MKMWSKAETEYLDDLVESNGCKIMHTWFNVAVKLNRIYNNNRTKESCRKKWTREILSPMNLKSYQNEAKENQVSMD